MSLNFPRKTQKCTQFAWNGNKQGVIINITEGDESTFKQQVFYIAVQKFAHPSVFECKRKEVQECASTAGVPIFIAFMMQQGYNRHLTSMLH